jgi:hypothetical protein
MSWMTVGGCALVAFIVVALGYIAVVFIRNFRANGLPEPPGYAAPYLSILEGSRASIEFPVEAEESGQVCDPRPDS